MKKGLIVMVLAVLLIGGFSQIVFAVDSSNSSKESSSVKKDEKKDKSSKKKKSSSKKSKSKKNSKKSEKSKKKSKDSKKKKSTVDKSKLKYPDQKKVGEGTVGKETWVIGDKLTWTLRKWDTSKPAFIYIDSKLVETRLMTKDNDEVLLNGLDWAQKKGKHYIEIVQYDNDKEDGNIVTYKTSYYKMK